MKLTATVKLLPTPEQRRLLRQTLERANAACNFVSGQAWQARTFNLARLHHIVYYAIRSQFALAAQMAVRCIGKVVDAYKKDKHKQRKFNPLGAFPYDDRILTYKIDKRVVSIWTLSGRIKIPFTCGNGQLELLYFQSGESDLVYQNGEFYLFATCNLPDDTPLSPEGFLGVDLGITNIATDSDGTIHSARHLLNVRHRHRRLRRKLQKKGTRSAKRRLKQLSGKERRFAKDVNHCISKKLVKIAKDTQRGIALEDLTGIRDRATFTRKRRNLLHSWSFAQLRFFMEYKAQISRVVILAVDPRNTSRQCSVCGHIDKGNRKTQSSFQCLSCGHVSHADVNAAINISRRGAVIHPYVARDLGK